jgi:predicted DCC family thiol-disulfide oxidoreductase YuxK
MPSNSTYDVFMDGSCSFCRWSQSKVEPYDTYRRVRFLDYNDPAVAAQAPFSRDELAA